MGEYAFHAGLHVCSEGYVEQSASLGAHSRRALVNVRHTNGSMEAPRALPGCCGAHKRRAAQAEAGASRGTHR